MPKPASPLAMARTIRWSATVGLRSRPLDMAMAFCAPTVQPQTIWGARVAIKGQLVPVVGRVSMDTIAIDITDLGPNGPVPGEMVEILGPNVSIDDLADAAGTIGYEILTNLHGRYRRNYIGAAE